jgi:outer membrane lipoprotein SlyB
MLITFQQDFIMKQCLFIVLAAVSLVTLTGCTNEYNYPNRTYVGHPANTVVVKQQPTVVRTPSTVVVR